MDDYKYCNKRVESCFRNQPLHTVVSQWFNENHDIVLDFNPAAVIYFGFLCLIAWILIKIFFRIIKSMLKPFLVIVGLLIVVYTKQFSNSIDGIDFILNVFTNTISIFLFLLETVNRILFVEPVVV